MAKFLISIFKFNFGEFEEREFKKLLRMGIIFLLLIGLYWTMRPLKDSIFKHLFLISLKSSYNCPISDLVINARTFFKNF